MYTGVPPVCALQAIHATTWKIRMPLMKVLQVGEWGGIHYYIPIYSVLNGGGGGGGGVH